jgi:hypothetical protein
MWGRESEPGAVATGPFTQDWSPISFPVFKFEPWIASPARGPYRLLLSAPIRVHPRLIYSSILKRYYV